MHASLNPIYVSAIKKELAENLPELKSGTRAQALARGLGYRTSSSLASALKHQEENPPGFLDGFVDEEAFVNFLSAGNPSVDEDTRRRWREVFLSSVIFTSDFFRWESNELTALLTQGKHWNLGRLGYSDSEENIPTAAQKRAYLSGGSIQGVVPVFDLKEFFLATKYLEHRLSQIDAGSCKSEELATAAVDWFKIKYGHTVSISVGWIIAAAILLEMPCRRQKTGVKIVIKQDPTAVDFVNAGPPRGLIHIPTDGDQKKWGKIFRQIVRSDGDYRLPQSEEVGWPEGYIAGTAGQLESDCPYEGETKQACYWMSGYFEGAKSRQQIEKATAVNSMEISFQKAIRIRDFLNKYPPHQSTDLTLNFRGTCYSRAPDTRNHREISLPDDISAVEFYSYLRANSRRGKKVPNMADLSGLVPSIDEVGEYEIRWIYYPKIEKIFIRNVLI